MEQRIWITTDTHLYHAKLPSLDPRRPLDYEQRILDGLSVIGKDDTFLHLGDISMGHEVEAHKDLWSAVKADRRILVRGNHDKKSDTWYTTRGWSFVCEWFTVFKYGHSILFSHVPVPYGRVKMTSLNIHGHTHGGGHRSLDVGSYIHPAYNIEIALENTDYKPVLLTDKLIKGVG